MYIIVVGGSRVGSTLSQSLLELGHEVLVIERSSATCAELHENLGSVVMQGDGCEVAVLAEAGAERADVFIAVTDGDEDNLVACQVAQHRFQVPHLIARVNNPRNEQIFKLLGITRTVNAVDSLTNAVLQQIPSLALSRLLLFQHNNMALLGIRIPQSAQTIGKRISDVRLPEGSAVALIVQRQGGPQLPSSEASIQPDDEIIVLAKSEDEAALVQTLTG